jgi:hypothetical protein
MAVRPRLHKPRLQRVRESYLVDRVCAKLDASPAEYDIDDDYL